MVIVYGIIHEGKLKYIGSTKNFPLRIIKKRPFLTKDNFIIIKGVPFNTQFNVELDLIHYLQPEYGKGGKQMKREAVTIMIDKEDKDKLIAYCKEHDYSISHVIRQLVKKFNQE